MKLRSSGRLITGAAVAVVVLGGLAGASPARAVVGGSSIDEAAVVRVERLGTRGLPLSACTGTFVGEREVITLGTCVFPAGSPGQPGVKPRLRIVGIEGATVSDVVRHPSADVALIFLEKVVESSVWGHFKVAKSQPAMSEELTFIGAGRTRTEWVPDEEHEARLRVEAVQPGSVSVAGAADGVGMCQGDAGGPMLRSNVERGRREIVALASTGQAGGCHGSRSVGNRGTAVRLDEIVPWLWQYLPDNYYDFEEWERPLLANAASFAQVSGVGGLCCQLPGPQIAISGDRAVDGDRSLMYAGRDNNSTRSFAYLRAFSFSGGLTVGYRYNLTYWIYPESSSSTAGSNSTCVAVDLLFSDGKSLRDSGAKDWFGNKAHPANQCGKLKMNSWNPVDVDLAPVYGKTVVAISIGYDQPKNTGGYRGYIDGVQIGLGCNPPPGHFCTF